MAFCLPVVLVLYDTVCQYMHLPVTGTVLVVDSRDHGTVQVQVLVLRDTGYSDVISVNRRMCKCTVVGTVTTFSVGRRTDVNGGAGSGFSMMISHGQACLG